MKLKNLKIYRLLLYLFLLNSFFRFDSWWLTNFGLDKIKALAFPSVSYPIENISRLIDWVNAFSANIFVFAYICLRFEQIMLT